MKGLVIQASQATDSEAQSERVRALLDGVLSACLRPYSQIVFSEDRRTGVLVLSAFAWFPRLALATALAVAVAHAVTWLMGLGAGAMTEGGYACTAVLATTAAGVFAPASGQPWLLIVLAAAMAVPLMASFRAAFSSLTLPAHSLPFIATAWCVQLAARYLPGSSDGPTLLDGAISQPEWLSAPWLSGAAALLFLKGDAVGALVIAAVLVHSRIALLLGGVGMVVALGAHEMLRGGWSDLDTLATFNAALTAMALGGVWYVPSLASLVLAAAASALSVAVTYALSAVASIAFLPVLSLPFAVTTHLFVLAGRQRQADRRPRSTPPATTPEVALASELMRTRLFGDTAWVPFRLPFRGPWAVTQGYNGAYTHQGPWRHGLDFEVLDAEGGNHSNDGTLVQDYHCYSMPVLAAGHGVVASVKDGVNDNAPGEANVHENWGNAVVIAHSQSLHSVYAHLQKGSITVKQGEQVRAGTAIGRCGASGRAPMPHLHFQVQRTPTLGSPTVASDFGDVVTHSEGREVLATRTTLREGDIVRPVVRDPVLASALGLAPESIVILRSGGVVEHAQVELDLWGRRTLKSKLGRVLFDPYDNGFVVLDYQGSHRSQLRVFALALARVPFDQATSLRWEDRLPRRFFMRRGPREVADLATMLAPNLGSMHVQYESVRRGAEVVITGRSRKWNSEATLSLASRLHRLRVTDGARTFEVEVEVLDPNRRSPLLPPEETGGSVAR